MSARVSSKNDSGVWFVGCFFLSVCVVISVLSETEGKCISHFARVNLGKSC